MAWQFEGCRVAGDGSDYRKGTTPSGNAWRSTRARAAPQSAGKWYYPIFLTQGGSEDFGIGFATGDAFQVPNSYIGRGADSVGFYASTSGGYTNEASVAPNAKPTYGSWMTVALDIDAGEARLFDNAGAQVGETVGGLAGGAWLPAYSGIRPTPPSDNFVAFIDLAEAEHDATPPAGYSAWPPWVLVEGAPKRVDTYHTGGPLPARDLANLQRNMAPFAMSGGRVHCDTSLARLAGIRSYFGPGVLEGKVRTLNVPSVDLVRIYERDHGWLVSEQVSAEDGTYRFVGLSIEEYKIVGVDREREYELVGLDARVPDIP